MKFHYEASLFVAKVGLGLLGSFCSLKGAIKDLDPPMPYLFHLDAAYSFAHIPRIQGGFNPSNYSTDENKLTLSGWMTTMSHLELGLLFEFNQTDRLPFNLESGGFYGKKNFFDDWSGDKFGLDAGVLVQFVPTNRLRDPITPYNDIANFTLFGEIYKNFLFRGDAITITPVLGADLGMANRGYPWLNPFLGGRLSMDPFLIDLSFLGSFGFGNRTTIDVSQFRGYAFTAYRSIDVEVLMSYAILEEGSLSVGYFNRLFARAFPQGRQGFFVQLDLPIPIL